MSPLTAVASFKLSMVCRFIAAMRANGLVGSAERIKTLLAYTTLISNLQSGYDGEWSSRL